MVLSKLDPDSALKFERRVPFQPVVRPLSSQRRRPYHRAPSGALARAVVTVWLAAACSQSPAADAPPEGPSEHSEDAHAEADSHTAADVTTADTPATTHVAASHDSVAAGHESVAAATAPNIHSKTKEHHAPAETAMGDHHAASEATHDHAESSERKAAPERRPKARGALPDFYDSADAERLDQLWTRPGVTVVMARRRPFDGVLEVATDRVPDENTAQERRREFARLGYEPWPPSPRPELAPVGDPGLAQCPFLIADERTGMPFDPRLDTRPVRGVIVCAKNLDELEGIVRGNIASAVAVKRAAPCRELLRVDPEAGDGAVPKKSAKGDSSERGGAPGARGKRAAPSRHSRPSLMAMRAICRDMRAMFALGYPFRTAPADH